MDANDELHELAAAGLIDGATYRQQFIRCGKPKCQRCRRGPTHGPYWYAEWQSGSKTRTKYIGRRLPAAIAAWVARVGTDEARAAAAEQLAEPETRSYATRDRRQPRHRSRSR